MTEVTIIVVGPAIPLEPATSRDEHQCAIARFNMPSVPDCVTACRFEGSERAPTCQLSHQAACQHITQLTFMAPSMPSVRSALRAHAFPSGAPMLP